MAIGARQDAEKAAAELRERLEERERDAGVAREVSLEGRQLVGRQLVSLAFVLY